MNWDKLIEATTACKNCELAQTRTQVVFGTGNPQADVLFIGEAPGQTEDEMGLPFVGRSGKLLDDMLSLIDLKREQIFISNIVKCRPPANRDPLPHERAACTPWLEWQLKIMQPKIVVCLGRVAAMYFIRPDFKMMRDHGAWFENADGIFTMGMYHPAAILRDPRRRPEAFADFKTLQNKMKELKIQENM